MNEGFLQLQCHVQLRKKKQNDNYNYLRDQNKNRIDTFFLKRIRQLVLKQQWKLRSELLCLIDFKREVHACLNVLE